MRIGQADSEARRRVRSRRLDHGLGRLDAAPESGGAGKVTSSATAGASELHAGFGRLFRLKIYVEWPWGLTQGQTHWYTALSRKETRLQGRFV